MAKMDEKLPNDLSSYAEIQLPSSIKNMPRCDWCNKPLPKRHVIHKNQCQEHSEHRFCSKICKDNWIQTQRT